MSAFHERTFAERFSAMGDEAEGVFTAVYPEGWVRTGLDRPPINVGKLPLKVRYTPDFLTSKGYVEVMGCGSDRRLKLKVEKLQALGMWHLDFRTDLFVWDRPKTRYGWVRYEELVNAVDGCPMGEFREGKSFYRLSLSALPAVWKDLET